MNRKEYLLCVLAEECNEVAHRISKAMRFGLDEVQEGTKYNNADRIMHEVNDLLGVLEMCIVEGVLQRKSAEGVKMAMLSKQAQVEKYYAYSIERGVITDRKLLGDRFDDMQKSLGDLILLVTKYGVVPEKIVSQINAAAEKSLDDLEKLAEVAKPETPV